MAKIASYYEEEENVYSSDTTEYRLYNKTIQLIQIYQQFILGHRDRFRTIFAQLKSFYNQARNLQYFVNLITVPKLPENAPNFSSQVDFGAYTPPVVVVPESDTESMVGNLVDMTTEASSPTADDSPQESQPPPAINFEQIVRERDELILHLQTEVDRLA